MSYYTKITNAGLSEIVSAINSNSKVPITYMAFGDGNGSVPTPSEDAISLVNEVYRVGLNKIEKHTKNPNWLVCEAIIPSAVGGFNIREVGLLSNSGKLLAIASYPPTYKPSVEEGAAKIQTIRIILQVDNVGNFELIVDPDVVLATVQYVNEATARANNSVTTLEELINLNNPKDGQTVYVSTINPPVFGTAYPFSGGGYYRFSTQSNKVSDGYIVIDTPTGKWLKQFEDITVDDFGALGNGDDDDSEAFNKFVRSPYTGINIKLGENQRVYRISKQVDCKNKGLIGNGFSKQHENYYKHSSIRVDGTGEFEHPDEKFNNKAFINVGAEVRQLQLKCDNLNSLDGIQIDGYNITINGVNVTGFRYQFYVHTATVSFRVSDLMSIGAGEAGFYIHDISNAQSTTAYFTRCSWQWGKKPIHFRKEVYGCSFRDIIIEHMHEGLTAASWADCTFDTIWAEGQQGGAGTEWLVNTDSQQTWNCHFSNLKIREPWLNRCAPNSIALPNNTGGVVIDDSMIALNGQTGAKILLSVKGIETRFADWYAGSPRKLRITTQPTASGSNYKTPLHIDAPNNELYFGNENETSNTPVVFKRVIGADATGNKYYAPDVYTKLSRKWGTYNHGSGHAGAFYAPMMLTYDQSFAAQQINNGWQVVKEAVGVYRVERLTGNVSVITNPHIQVGPPVMGSRKGDGSIALPSLQMIDTYSGSWTSYTEASGFKIFWKDLTGAAIDPWRFTVSFTATS